MNHTRGPWKAIRIGGELTGSVFAGKKRICSGICDDVRLVKEVEANSALIEATPDMLEALEGAKWLILPFAQRSHRAEDLLILVSEESEGGGNKNP